MNSYNNMHKILFTLLFLTIVYSFSGCAGESDTILVGPVTGSLPSEDIGTLYPMIQKVYPGTLQSLDIPQSYPSDVSPEYPGIVVIFSHVMENDNNEMGSSIELIDVSTGQISVTVSPAVSSKYFTVSPVSGSLNPGTEYVLRIYKYASADTSVATATVSRSSNRATITTPLAHGLSNNEVVTITGVTADGSYDSSMVSVVVIDSTSFSYANTGSDMGTTADTGGSVMIFSHTLSFDNLVTPPAITVSPADPLFVEYKFQTGEMADVDTTPPTIAFTNIADGAVNVDPDPLAGDGYIEIIFYDNMVPMIDPSTVNDLSVTLWDVTSAIPQQVFGNISFVDTDTDFKTFRFYPFPITYLLQSTEYRLRISESPYYVEDFSGNNVTQKDIYFSTGHN